MQRSILFLAALLLVSAGTLRAQNSSTGLFGLGGQAADSSGGASEPLQVELSFHYMSLEPMQNEWFRALQVIWEGAASMGRDGYSFDDAGRYIRAAEAADGIAGRREIPGAHHGGGGPTGPAKACAALLAKLKSEVDQDASVAASFRRIEGRRLARVFATLLEWSQGVGIRSEIGSRGRTQDILPRGSAAPVEIEAPAPFTGRADAALKEAVKQERATLVRMAYSNAQFARERLEAMLAKKSGIQRGAGGFAVRYDDVFDFEGEVKRAAFEGRVALVELGAQVEALRTLEDTFGRALPDRETAGYLEKLEGEVQALTNFCDQHRIVAELRGERSFPLGLGGAAQVP